MIHGPVMKTRRMALWSQVAVAASRQYMDIHGPALVADAVLQAFDERFCGVKASVPVPVATHYDPVDEVMRGFL